MGGGFWDFMPSCINIAVMPIKTIPGCGTIRTQEGIEFFQNNCLEVMPFETMLSSAFKSDAHFVCYNIPGFPMWPRLNKSVLQDIREDGCDIVLPVFAFDWDNQDHQIWTDRTLENFARRIDALDDSILSKWTALYTTKHGARFIYQISNPVPADDAEQHLTWMLRRFLDQGFLEIDSNCKDWTRCFRCPQVNRDGVRTETEWYYFLQHRPEQRLLVSELGKLPAGTIARKHNFDKSAINADPPTFEELDRLLVGINQETRRSVQSDYFKRAKKALKDTPYFDILFNHAPPGWVVGTRNNEVLKMLGVITPILIKRCFATIQQVFALAVYPVLTLDNIPGKQDPVKHAWNALCDIYERENNKINIEAEDAAKKLSRETKTLDAIAAGMREWYTGPELQKDEESAREFVRKRCLASVGTYFFLIGENGYYEPFPVNSGQVISRIRKGHLEGIIPTTRPTKDGEVIDIQTQVLQNTYSTSVSDILMKPVGDKGGFITDMDGEKPALVLSTFTRNTALKPEFNEFVDKWLKCLFGKEYKVGCAWIANALAFEEGLICALSLEGASNAGKKLLTVGLSECLKEPHIAGPTDIYEKSSAFLKTPFLVINEAWPDSRVGISPADTFKSLTGGDGIRVRELYKPAVTVLCPVRIILTANDDGIVRTLTKGKDMTLDNRIAIGQRLLHIKVPEAAQVYLQKIGGMGFTAKEGQRWIRPDSGNVESNYIVAKHFLWLYENRKPVDKSQRFLVMGNSAPGCGDNGQMTVFEKLLADNNSTPIVAQAIIEMGDKASGVWAKYIRIDLMNARLWVTRYGVYKYVQEVLQQRVADRDLYNSMQNLLAAKEPMKGNDKNHWYEINVEALAMIAFERAIPQTVIGKLNEIHKAIKASRSEKEAMDALLESYKASPMIREELEESFERKVLGI